MPTEADACRKFVVPKLQASGWETEPHSILEQRPITDGRIVPRGKGYSGDGKAHRGDHGKNPEIVGEMMRLNKILEVFKRTVLTCR